MDHHHRVESLITIPDFLTLSAIITTILCVLSSLFWLGRYARPAKLSKERLKTLERLRNIGEPDQSLGLEMYVQGLYNIGNSCFLNSVLQGLAPLCSLHTYLDSACATPSSISPVQSDLKKDEILQPTSSWWSWLSYLFTRTPAGPAQPLAHTLAPLLHALNEPLPYPKSTYPSAVMSSLRQSKAGFQLLNQQQQDAHEIFTEMTNLLTPKTKAPSLLDALKTEAPGFGSGAGFVKVRYGPGYDDKWFMEKGDESAEMPFLGLISSRVVCSVCGYMEAVRHFASYSLSLTLPYKPHISLHDCLSLYTEKEQVDDVLCAACTRAARDKLEAFKRNLEGGESEAPKPGRRKRKSVEDQNIQVRTPHTKQVMIARAPKVLVLHLVRTMLNPYGSLIKHSAPVHTPALLDITPYLDRSESLPPPSVSTLNSSTATSSGHQGTTESPIIISSGSSEGEDSDWDSMGESRDESVGSDQARNMIHSAVSPIYPLPGLRSPLIPSPVASTPISATHPKLRRLSISQTTQSSQHQPPPVTYELKSAICHSGIHSYGHYTCYRRLGTKWFRTSDANVNKVKHKSVFEDDGPVQRGAYMLFYERQDSGSETREGL